MWRPDLNQGSPCEYTPQITTCTPQVKGKGKLFELNVKLREKHLYLTKEELILIRTRVYKFEKTAEVVFLRNNGVMELDLVSHIRHNFRVRKPHAKDYPDVWPTTYPCT